MLLSIALVVIVVGSLVLTRQRSSRLRRITLNVFLVTSGALVISSPTAPGRVWSVDNLSRLSVAMVVILGCVIGGFAIRQFEGERRSNRLVAATVLVIGTAMMFGVAHSLVTLVLAWSATSVATITIISVGDTAPHSVLGSWTRRTLVAGDASLLVVSGWIVWRHGDLVLGSANHLPLDRVESALLVGVAFIAAAMRAGLTLRHSWVTETVQAPTSVSALLHAGVVNAGALLLIRISNIAQTPLLERVLAATACLTVIAVLSRVIVHRVDLKGQLATSTVSQMAFMLLAVELGWPLLAVTHVVGHAFYKAYRFMDAGNAIARRARWRRLGDVGVRIDLSRRVWGLVAIAGVMALAVSQLPRESWAVGGVFTLAACAIWWNRSGSPLLRPLRVGAVITASALSYTLLVDLLQHWLGTDVTPQSPVAPWWTLSLLVLIIGAVRRRSTRNRATISTVPTNAGANAALVEVAR